MKTPKTLPGELNPAGFSIAEGRRAGLSRKRLAGPDLDAPFRATRAATRPESPLDLVAAYAPKMTPAEFFSHATAALLLGMWLPLGMQEQRVVHVSVVKPARAPRDRLVRGHHLIERPGLVVTRHGYRIATPVEAWCQLATMLAVIDLVVAGESLLAKGSHEPEVMLDRLIAAASDEHRPASGKLLRAARALRIGVRSPWETRLRLLLVEAGIPEPAINARIRLPGTAWEIEGDLVFRAERVIVEYEGDYHRSDVTKWRSDITRYERMQDLGWRIIRVTADDIRLRPEETVERVRRALERA